DRGRRLDRHRRDHPQGRPRRGRGAGRRRRGRHPGRAGRGDIRRQPRPRRQRGGAAMSGRARPTHDWLPRPLPDNVTGGERSWLYSAYALVHCRSRRPRAVRVGRDSGVYAGSFFDLGPRGEVEVGDFCTLVGAVFACNSRVVIGDYVFVAHEVTFADGFAATPGAGDEGGEPHTSIVLGANTWVGARSVLLAGARVGPGAIVGAGTVVDCDVPPYGIIAGDPARVVGSCAPS